MRGARLIAVLIGMLGIPVFVQGQQGLRDRDPDLEGAKKIAAELQEANIHYGDFYMLSRIRISDAGFSEDVYLPTGDIRGGFNLRVDAPQRIYLVPHKKTVFTAELVPAYNFFRAGSRKGQFDYRARADAHFLFNHLYLDTYVLLTDQIRAHVADVNRLATQKEDETGITGELKYSSRTSAIFSGRYREVRYPEDRYQPVDSLGNALPLELLERVERNARLALHHKTFPVTSLFVAGEASNYSFRRATFKDSARKYLGGGFVRQSGRMSVRAEAGQTRLEFDDPAWRDYSGITAQASIDRSRAKWSYGASAARDVDFSIFFGNNYFITTTGRAFADYAATRRLNLRVSTAVERDTYETPVNGILRRDTLTFSTVGFLYSFRKLRTGLDMGWFTRESNFDDDDSGIRWVLHLSFTP